MQTAWPGTGSQLPKGAKNEEKFSPANGRLMPLTLLATRHEKRLPGLSLAETSIRARSLQALECRQEHSANADVIRDRSRSVIMSNPKTELTDNTQKDPDEWVSGDDPMTGAQAS
jgi:hypothetical protein